MRNRLLLSAAVFAVLLVVVAWAGVVAPGGFLTRQNVSTVAAEDGNGGWMSDRPLVNVPGLQQVPPDQVFDHFMGGQMNFTDGSGNTFMVNVTPGTVTAVDTTTSPQTVTITPNGQTSTKVFNITSNTTVHGMPNKGSLMALSVGDKVVVAVQDNSTDAIAVTTVPHGYSGGMGMGLMDLTP